MHTYTHNNVPMYIRNFVEMFSCY